MSSVFCICLSHSQLVSKHAPSLKVSVSISMHACNVKKFSCEHHNQLGRENDGKRIFSSLWLVCVMRYFRRDILSKNSADPSICRCLNGFLSGLFINIHKMFYEIDLIALHDSIPGNIFCTYSSLWQSINNPRRNGVFSKVIAHKISHSSDADFIETNLQPNKSLSFHKELELWQDEPFWYCCITGPPINSVKEIESITAARWFSLWMTPLMQH